MSEPFIAQITMFAGNFAPRGWALCDGQLLAINSNTALFSLIGTIYGGDGETSMGLPELRGRLPMHPGNGPGLTNRSLGQKQGAERHTLTVAQMPNHNHTATHDIALKATNNIGNLTTPGGNVAARANDGESNYAADDASVNQTMPVSGSVSIANQGGNQPVDHMPPFLCVNFIIALVGVFPSEN